jgi:hypothetical protein
MCVCVCVFVFVCPVSGFSEFTSVINIHYQSAGRGEASVEFSYIWFSMSSNPSWQYCSSSQQAISCLILSFMQHGLWLLDFRIVL